MPPRKLPPEHRKSRAVDVAKAFGPDGTIFSIVGAGAFAALFKGASAWGVASVAAIVLGGWLANKWVNAYLAYKKQQLQLDELRQKTGVRLLERHAAKQPELPLDDDKIG